MSLKSILADMFKSVPYAQERAKTDFAVALERRLEKLGIKRGEYAGKLEKSPSYVSRVLGGNENLTLESMVALVHPLNAKLRIEIVDESADRNWVCPADDKISFNLRGFEESFGSYAGLKSPPVNDFFYNRAPLDTMPRPVAAGG